MDPLEIFSAYTGKWQGTNRLQNPNTNAAEDSQSKFALTPILLGKFIRADYMWDSLGKPQEGSMLIGYNKETDETTLHWIDTWHNGNSVMVCRGKTDQNGNISVFGTFPAPPDPDRGWTIKITPQRDSINIVMHCVPPEGKGDAFFACEANYNRSAEQ
jgi:hypothetical protein